MIYNDIQKEKFFQKYSPFSALFSSCFEIALHLTKFLPEADKKGIRLLIIYLNISSEQGVFMKNKISSLKLEVLV